MFSYPPKIQNQILSKVIRAGAETSLLTMKINFLMLLLFLLTVNVFVHTKVQKSKDIKNWNTFKWVLRSLKVARGPKDCDL